MWKIKKFRRVPDYDYVRVPVAAAEHGYPGDGWYHGFRHEVRGRRAWVSQREMDSIDSLEHSVYCTLRARDVRRLPDSWDDLPLSRGFWIRSWKDKTKRKKQWES